MQRRAHPVIAGVLAAVAAAEWLYGLDGIWVWLTGFAGVATAGLALLQRPWRPAPLLAGLASLLLDLALIVGGSEIHRIECCWPARREARVMAASHALAATLADAVTEARRLAEQGAIAGARDSLTAFRMLARAMARGAGSLERGVVVLAPDGQPYAWAGRHRAVPTADTAELRAIITPFYVTLEARRQTSLGRSAVGTVLLDAAPAVADRRDALSFRFALEHGVGLRFARPGTAPRDSDEFDFCAARCDASPVLFTVRPQPPSQGDAKLAVLQRTAAQTEVLLALTLGLLLVTAPPGRWRWLVVLAAAWTAARGLFGPAAPPPALFSPATFYRPLLGEFSDSAGSLLALAGLVLLAASALWRRALPRRWWSLGLAGVLLLYAPYLVRYLGRGIAPPASGVSLGLWLSWEAALATAAMALVLLAAALVRGPNEPKRRPWIVAGACAWAALAGAAGLWLWRPSDAWPEWYTFLWLPALAGVIVPAPRRLALLGIATVAGTAVALVTWGAAVEGRLALAGRDAQRLGVEPDPLATAELERLGAQALADSVPTTAADLYELWRGSPLAGEGYPTVLAAWNGRGDELAELRLAAVDLPTPLLLALSRPEPRSGLHVERLARVPGVHYVLSVPLPGDDVLTVGVGPRSRLVPASRVARFLAGEALLEPPYTITLTQPAPASEPTDVRWVREGWTAHAHRVVTLPTGTALVHLVVDLRGPWPLLVRAMLVVLFDVALLALAWALSRVVTDGSWLPPRWPSLRQVFRSYRGRLTLVLAAFFVVPVLAFSLWSFARLGDTTRASGDLL
ncbi:MAG: hypothetical protein ACM37V_07165, partial [Gemmatimonadota bacterium]